MNEIKDGGPAFPCDEQIRDSMIYQPEPGMTLRDYFAAKLMPVVWNDHKPLNDYDCALLAYRMADAMLRARGQS
ncbi:hypothetical protein LMG22037_05496 [Paraburkholderia phenoliruptrix]|uniref:Uncharacterized protein n=1 Tax=Paraburkholderia phenoliruptrix TaxID=252970 RepID=A0A6J5C7Y0_9BURK|nr:hypothetical protein [Paraburkholderia phenoliruptrix]CAB3730002.1 hypothetical protein LMG22037_05496 [Paraburkholderia phenoliruptrix]